MQRLRELRQENCALLAASDACWADAEKQIQSVFAEVEASSVAFEKRAAARQQQLEDCRQEEGLGLGFRA